MRSQLTLVLGTCLLAVGMTGSITAQDGIGEQIGRKIDQGISELSEELQQSWAQIRAAVDQLGVQGRVYGRLHWDKQLKDAKLDVQVQAGNVVILEGIVSTDQAKKVAGQLAENTIGVERVVNQLVVNAAP